MCAWELILAWEPRRRYGHSLGWYTPSLLFSLAHLLFQWTSFSHRPSRNLDVEVLTSAVFLSHLALKVWVTAGWDGMSPRLTHQTNDFCTSLHSPPFLLRSPNLLSSGSVSQNFLATCTITPTPSSMHMNDRTFLSLLPRAISDTPFPGARSMSHWSVALSLLGP